MFKARQVTSTCRMMVTIYKLVCLAVVITVVYCLPEDLLKKLPEGRAHDEADSGTLEPCEQEDIEYEFSHVCPHIYWSPGGPLDPRREIRLGTSFNMPFDIDEGTILVTIKVEDQPIFQDRLDFTCEMLNSVQMYLPHFTDCPVLKNTPVTVTYTLTDLLSLNAFPGEYQLDLRLKNIDGYGICCKAEFKVLA